MSIRNEADHAKGSGSGFFSSFSKPKVTSQKDDFRELRLQNTVLSHLTSTEYAYKFYLFSIRSDVAVVRGICSAVGACFGFLSLLKVTPAWTSFIYFLGLLPEMLKLAMHIDTSAHSMLIREFEYIVVVASGLLFGGIMAYVLQDLRSVVPLTIFLVVLASQAQDASIPFEQNRLSAALYYVIGGGACVAVYILVQFGFVPDIAESQLQFGGANGKLVTAFVAYFYPDCFVTLRGMISKKIVLKPDTDEASAAVAVQDLESPA